VNQQKNTLTVIDQFFKFIPGYLIMDYNINPVDITGYPILITGISCCLAMTLGLPVTLSIAKVCIISSLL
jgi:hypothetical protein